MADTTRNHIFKRNQSSDNRSHGFGADFYCKLSASDFSYERKSAFKPSLLSLLKGVCDVNAYVWQSAIKMPNLSQHRYGLPIFIHFTYFVACGLADVLQENQLSNPPCWNCMWHE